MMMNKHMALLLALIYDELTLLSHLKITNYVPNKLTLKVVALSCKNSKTP